MTLFALITLSLCQIAWIVLGVLWVARRHDEIPLLISAVLFYVFTFRLWALLMGWTSPVNLTNFGFDPLDSRSALDVESIAILGQTVLLSIYMLAQRRRIDVPDRLASPELLGWLKPRVVALGVICILISLLARRSVGVQLASGRSMGFEVSSYLILFSLSLVGVAILIAALWKSRAFHTAGERFGASLLFVAIIYLTFQPSMRFQFLGWFVAVDNYLVFGPFLRASRSGAGIGLIGAVALFAVAGALRNAEEPTVELEQSAWERFAFAEDANMLDGFALLRQVYPEMLDYSYGGEHLEILARPIPRAWWPDKPVGGYMNKLGIITADSGFMLGISPSLFGSFYQEGGLVGVVLLSIIYGFGFGRLVSFSTRIVPLAGLLLRGILAAAIVPLLRGGDLPGIYAWFGMSFWPCLLLLWLGRHDFFARIPYRQQFADGGPVPMEHRQNRRAQFGVKNDSIAILFDQLGPYHWARLQAAARLFRVVAVETYAITREYQWDRIDEPRAFDRITLFDDVSDGRSPKRALLRQKMAKALCEADPEVAMIPGWGTPASLIALEWCLRNRRPAVVMSESNAFDEKRYAFTESIKRIVVSLFSAGLAGGQLQMEYLIVLGLPRDRVFTGYDVVDNEYFRRKAEEVRSHASEARRKYGLPEKYFLASARFVPKKNLPTLIRAYAHYRQVAGNLDNGQRTTAMDLGIWSFSVMDR